MLSITSEQHSLNWSTFDAPNSARVMPMQGEQFIMQVPPQLNWHASLAPMGHSIFASITHHAP